MNKLYFDTPGMGFLDVTDRVANYAGEEAFYLNDLPVSIASGTYLQKRYFEAAFKKAQIVPLQKMTAHHIIPLEFITGKKTTRLGRQADDV